MHHAHTGSKRYAGDAVVMPGLGGPGHVSNGGSAGPAKPSTQARLNAEKAWLRVQRKQFEVTRLPKWRARQ